MADKNIQITARNAANTGWDNLLPLTTKNNVGLGNVENYAIATQLEAQQGTVTNKYMNPLRTKEAILALAPAPVIASTAEAQAGTDNTKVMTPLRTKEAMNTLTAAMITADGATNVQAEITSLKSSVSDGKNLIASAITDMNQTAAGSDTFAVLAGKITSISNDANALVGDVLTTKTFYQGGVKRTGTMPNRGAVSQSLAINGTYTIPSGYHSGTGTVSQSVATKGAQTFTPGTTNQTIAANQWLTGIQTISGSANLTAANIKSGVNIFGVVGSLPPLENVPTSIVSDNERWIRTTVSSKVATTVNEIPWTIMRQFRVTIGGTLKITFEGYRSGTTATYYAYFITKPVGSDTWTQVGSTLTISALEYTLYTSGTITVQPGMEVAVSYRRSTTYGVTGYLRNLRVLFDYVPGTTPGITSIV